MTVIENGVAVITGAASGIGLATAKRLARAGMHVVSADVDGALPLLFGPAERLSLPSELGKIRGDLPVLIASGSDDPLAGGGQLVELLGKRYRDAGIADVTVRVYPGARHEILNETNRDEVTADIVAWLTSHTPG
ncbi:MAG: SDR family NAD(P)-dependent oxidoreductase [Ilumatobacteraceae bacterium]